MDTSGERQRNETKLKEKEEWLKEIWCGGEGKDAVLLNGDEDNDNNEDNEDSENEEEFVPRNGFMVSL